MNKKNEQKLVLNITFCNLLNREITTWQDLRYANGTLEEWVKKSDAEIAAIDEEIREIRDLLNE